MAKTPDKQKEYQKRYMDRHKMLSVLLNGEKDKDIIDWLEKQENQSEAVREALREVRT
jgi:Arc/MetJ-type ribon-helix-helix transcriptional regulator